jgi:hypothetical protein
MRIPGFTAEASIGVPSQPSYTGRGSLQPSGSLEPSSVVPAALLNLCDFLLGCCRHGNRSCCDLYFDNCLRF